MATGTVLAMASGLVLTPPAGAADGPVAGAGQGGHQVTLITGDRVVVDSDGGVAAVLRAEGREDARFSIREVEGHTHVVPLDALGLIQRGVVDQQLFDVTELSRPEHRERSGDGLSVIVSYDGEQPSAHAELRAATQDEDRVQLDSIDAEALTLEADEAAGAWEALTDRTAGEPDARTLESGVSAVMLDGIVQASLDVSAPQIGAPSAWEAGYDGEGVTIAILDSGIDTSHPDLAGGRVVAERNFTEDEGTVDRYGHGTHVASIAAGTGARSGGTHTGVAPAAGLINARVLDDWGTGGVSQTIEGMEWAVAQGADIINMSLGVDDFPGLDPMEEAINRLSADSGVLFVNSAGNDGHAGAGTVGSPGSADAALTVGSVDKSGALAESSSRGPRVGDGALKPDLTAPGVEIVAAQSAERRIGRPAAAGYMGLSGTSMAAPHVAGAAALLKQRHPEWTGEQIKAALVASTTDLAAGHTAYERGSGLVDVSRALEQTVVAEPVSLGFGPAQWPHEDDEPQTRTLTYRNLGDEQVTLDLAAGVQGPDGAPGPEGMFTLSAGQVTIPAGGTAAVEVTADTTVGGDAGGHYSLLVTATGDGHSVRTAGAVDREVESLELTIENLDMEGNPVEFPQVDIWDRQTGLTTSIWGREEASLRLPAGDYLISSKTYGADADGADATFWQVRPNLDLSEDTTVVFDARETEPVAPTVFDDSAGFTAMAVGFEAVSPAGEFTGSTRRDLDNSPQLIYTQHLGPREPAEAFTSTVVTSWAGRATGAEYHAVHERSGAMVTGLTGEMPRSEFAAVEITRGAPVPGGSGRFITEHGLGRAHTGPVWDMPGTTTMYVTGGETRWSFGLEVIGDGQVFYEGTPRRYTAGETYAHTMHVGVFGPSLDGELGRLARLGNEISGNLQEFSDGHGNRAGYAAFTEASTVLSREGEVVRAVEQPMSWSTFEVPADEAAYELTTTVRRDAPVSTEVSATFTFTSAQPSGDAFEEIPVSVVRFTPELGLDSTARADRRMIVPVTVQGAAAGENLGSLVVEVSYDRGESWQEVPVHRGQVMVDNPAAGGSVSLRAEVSGTDGNTTVQTILDAYLTR
jgi:subtilisin family serine protease